METNYYNPKTKQIDVEVEIPEKVTKRIMNYILTGDPNNDTLKINTTQNEF